MKFKVLTIMFIVSILLSVGVYGDYSGQVHTPTVTVLSVVPSPAYEFNQANVTFRVESASGSNASISKVHVRTNLLNVIGALNPTGWTSTTGADYVEWTTVGSGISNGGSLRFMLYTTVPEIAIDLTDILTINTTDTDSVMESSVVNVSITNDVLAPIMDAITPLNATIVKNTSFSIDMTYIEAESGLFAANLSYRDNDDSSFDTDIRGGAVTGVREFDCDSGQCTLIFDLNLMGLAAGKYYMNAFITLVDNAGNLNDNNLYHLYIDQFEPDASIVSPVDGLVTKDTVLVHNFSASENSFASRAHDFDARLNCSLYVHDGVSYGILDGISLTANATTTLTSNIASMDDGIHLWYIDCIDNAGWSSQAARNVTRNFTLDTTGPIVTLNSPLNYSVIANGTIVNLSVNDDYSDVSNVWYEVNGIGMGNLTEPYNIATNLWVGHQNDLIVYANDTLGNIEIYGFTFFVDNEGPNFVSLLPLNDTFGDGDFNITVVDAYSNLSNCELFIDSIWNQNSNEMNNTPFSYSVTFTDGDYDWFVRCTDEVGNSADSETRIVKIDYTSPAVSLNAPANGTITTGNLDYNFSVVETNLDYCNVTIDGVPNNVGVLTNGSIVLTASNNAQLWSVTCWDLVGNSGVSGTRFVYYDNIIPIIGNVTDSAVDHDSAEVSWNTNEASCVNKVYFGTNRSALEANYSSGTLVAATAGLTPGTTLSSLSESTAYYYVVESCDRADNCNSSVGSVNTSTFTTSASPPPDDPPSNPPTGGGGPSYTDNQIDKPEDDGEPSRTVGIDEYLEDEEEETGSDTAGVELEDSEPPASDIITGGAIQWLNDFWNKPIGKVGIIGAGLILGTLGVFGWRKKTFKKEKGIEVIE